MRILLASFSAAFGVALAAVIGNRIPPAATPIIAGFMLGAGIAIPTTLLIAGILTSDNLRPFRPFAIPYSPHEPHVTWIEPLPPDRYHDRPHALLPGPGD